MENTLSTSGSSSSSNYQRANVTTQTTPQNHAPPNQWDATAGFIAVGIFQSTERFSVFKHSAVARKFIALKLSPETFDGQLIRAIGRQLVSGIVDRQSLCRAAWAFRKLGIDDDEVKASLETEALKILQSPDLPPNEQALILDMTAQVGKIGVSNDELLIVLADQVDRLFNNNWKRLTLQQMVQALAVLGKHSNIHPKVRDLLERLSHAVSEQESLDSVSFEEVTRLISKLPDLAELEGEGPPLMTAKEWVAVLYLSAQRVRKESSISPDQIVTLIKGLSFGTHLEKTLLRRSGIQGRTKDIAEAMKKERAVPVAEEGRRPRAVREILVVEEALDIVVTRLVDLGVGNHLRADCLADLVERIGESRLSAKLEEASLDLLGSQLVTPHGLAAIDKHQMEEILVTYLKSQASDAIKKLVITSLARKISEEAFQRPSRALYQEKDSYLRDVRSLLNLCDQFSATMPWITSTGPEAIDQVRNALSTLGGLLADIAEDPEVFKNQFLPFWNCLKGTHFLRSLNAEQVGKFLIGLHRTGIRAPKRDCEMNVGGATFQSKSFREFQESLARTFVNAKDLGNLTGNTVAGILRALGHLNLRSEQIAPCLNRLARHLRQSEMVESLTDAQLVYAAQGLGLPGVYSEPVVTAMTMVVDKLNANYLASSRLAISDDIEIAHALCGLSQHKHLSADVSDVMNLLAIHLSQDLSALSGDLACDTIYAISKADRPIPGVASAMCRLVKRWRQLDRISSDTTSPPLLRSSLSLESHRPRKIARRQPSLDVRNAMHSLARWLARPEVVAQLSATEVLDLLTLFSTPNCAEEDIQAAIDAMGTRLANEEFIGELTNSELTNALQLLLKPGLGSRGVVAATETLIPRWIALPNALEAVSPEQVVTFLTGIQTSGIRSQNIHLFINAIEGLISKWLNFPDTLKATSPEQVVALLTGIQKSGIRSQNIDLLIRALCQRLDGSSSPSLLSLVQIASCTKALEQFNIQSDEVVVAWCGLACRMKEKFHDWKPYSYPERQDPFFQMILYLNELPNKPEVLKLRDDFALHVGSHPKMVKAFSFAQIIHITDSYARLETPSDTVASTLKKLQKRLDAGR